MDMEQLRLLRTLRLKGRVLADDLPAATGLTDAECAELTGQFIAAGLVEEARDRLKLTVEGRDQLAGELTSELETIDSDQIKALYDEFGRFNTELKSLMTRWQLKDAETPNDHSDADYDQAVIDGLTALDADFRGLLARIVAAAPRLGHYPARFANALDRVNAGDHSWFAKPLADSYHTVWFELHEDLIGLAGLSRAEEAAAGRAE
ncbi:hypothetical protein BST36_21260 [Mycolicibacterium moriokaense]|jgi:pyruvate,orthophosphate dikinase|uniref:Uncharacterized protein n=2 Tax=Mycolicibacterium moriokaense TaxID=39691 RepID=A0AAD1H7H2_9MYCO|nr:hypothetical protein [Mycolicibacterium moriokaense]ORB19687.1 hypothetical protein BST36_21260 [Mycolicibacterium moriokaense]BBW99614.1 hypothetical protein MMOR_05510 [Mycolicibacterium moriokaense]